MNAKGDCSGRSLFLYKALYENNSEADIVLFGSSKTMCCINDSLLNQNGKEKYLNLGYCRFGHNLDLFFIEAYCKTHHPKKIVLEVRQIESGESHPLTSYLMPLSAFSINQYIMEDLYNKWLCNLKYARKNIFGKIDLEKNSKQNIYGYWPRNSTGLLSNLLKDKRSDSLKMLGLTTNSRLANESYFVKLKSICSKNGIKLYFLYLSSFGNVVQKPSCYNSYTNYGEVLCLPDSLLKDPSYFSDLGHFNYMGSSKVSLWLANQIGEK